MSYNKINNISGLFTASLALCVYLLTMEHSGSFWDCGEFLACAAKLEVGHAPGAPFFMIIQRFFAILAGSNPQRMTLFMNAESSVASALTILFLFWTITRFTRKMLVTPATVPGTREILLIMGAGFTGALAYTFSDTFWFSAVEAEVYATSSLFTALVFWAMLKWEAIATEPKADRWLVLIAYLIGLSVGVHLLNLLTIPAIAMVYYFKRYRSSRTGILLAFVSGCMILGLVQFGIIQYLPIIAAQFDLLFVNSFGLPYDSGTLFFIVLLAAILIVVLRRSRQKGQYLLHTATLCTCFIILGFSTYTVPLLRSRAEVGVDMTNPDNIHSLVAYVQRTQYLQQPLLSGPDYNTPVTGLKEKGPIYTRTQEQGKDHYALTDKSFAYEYDRSRLRFFPRIWDNSDPGKARFYRDFLGLDEQDIPTTADNISFFMGYQMNWMWFRYFMWNYAGRQNDLEGQGDAQRGNWMTGIKILDRPRVGNTDLMPEGLRDNRARNELYALPLLLGTAGCWYQWRRQRRDALVTSLLFFFTGIAIGIYLNMSALQPRERDYAFAGSTYAFAIWIGMSVPALQQLLHWLFKKNGTPLISITITLALGPVLMAAREWDDHDRSGLSLAKATARNVLESCAPNAILFTQADNDTYPLWYLQEVEGVRTDVRVIIIELAGADWYISQLQRKINQADAVPMIWKPKDYMGSNHNYISYAATALVPGNKYIPLEELCRFITSDDNRLKLPLNDGSLQNYLPSKNVLLKGPDKNSLVRLGLLTAADTALSVPDMKFTLPKDVLYKNDLTVLNIIAGIASEGWNRPIYFSGAYPGSNNVLNLAPYLRMEGVVYRLLPCTLPAHNAEDPGSVDLEKSSRLFLKEYTWGGASNKNAHLDEKNRVMLMAYRINAARLANALNQKDRKAEAIQIIKKVLKEIPERAYPHDITSCYLAESLYQCGQPAQAALLMTDIAAAMEAQINWTSSLQEIQQHSLAPDIRNAVGILQFMMNITNQYKDEATASRLEQQLQRLYPVASTLIGTTSQ